jgi:F-type H+-transporting ATPase subunit alpha
VIGALADGGMTDQTTVIAAGDEEAAGLAYIAPYAALTMAGHFAQQGRDVLVVLDDLTHHARCYRELSLLLRRPPGREAFPGDIFYIHARLLERAGQFADSVGGGSITVLPVVETQAENLSAYIPTNLISITDGQIYLSPSLFELGVLPAVDVGQSVSRVGGKAQRAAYRMVAGDLKLAYAQFEELETFARYGARLDDATRQSITYGRRIRACLRQPEFSPVSVPEQILVLLTLTAKLFDPVPLDQMAAAEQAVREAAAEIPDEVRARFDGSDKLSDDDRASIVEIGRIALEDFLSRAALTSVPEKKPEADLEPESEAASAGAS